MGRYEAISGQSINNKKSSICSSPNTTRANRALVCSQLGVPKTRHASRYLGMPMYMSKNKIEVFGFLEDRVNQKVQGCSNKSLSRAGKLVLLKSAAQALPNFWMSLFSLPVSICESIERIMNGFWWGNEIAGKGIRWLSWEKLCALKSGGGLGVRKLKNFDTAMLAKRSWRLLTRVKPVVSDIMKVRYFPNVDFLNATVGANSSYMWRSILEAQDLILEVEEV